MTWVRIDEGFSEHPKIARVGPLGAALQVFALCYCNRNDTDGDLPGVVARRLLDVPKPQKIIDALVKEGIWEVTDDGYHIHDFADYQPTRTQRSAEREAARERMQRVRSESVRPNNPRTYDSVRPKFALPGSGSGSGSEPEEQPPPLPSVEAPPAKRRRQRLPEDWQPSETLLAFAADKCPTVDVAAQTDLFRDHWRGKGEVRDDWDATFRNWLRRAPGFAPHTAGLATTNSNGSVPTNRENLLAAMREDGVIP